MQLILNRIGWDIHCCIRWKAKESVFMKLSVALCSYHGEHYIKEQLLSILNQTKVVDEIIVCDDGSTDGTVGVVEEVKRGCDVTIKIYINKQPIGVCANFAKAMQLCSGDIIFLSDQDDAWREDKVEHIVKWFEKNPRKSVVFTNAELIDGNGDCFTEKTLFDAVTFGKKSQKLFDRGMDFEVFVKHNRATGATMALRRSIVDEVQIDTQATSKNGKLLHDHVIALTALTGNRLGYIDENLTKYRIHSQQVCGLGKWLQVPPGEFKIGYPVFRKEVLMPYLTKEQKERLAFFYQRFTFHSSWFGWKVVSNAATYMKYYREMGLKIVSYDMKQSFVLSRRRIINAFNRHIRHLDV